MVKGSACPWPGSGKGQGERVWVPRVSAGLGDVLVELVVLLGGYLALRLGPDGLDLVRVRVRVRVSPNPNPNPNPNQMASTVLTRSPST